MDLAKDSAVASLDVITAYHLLTLGALRHRPQAAPAQSQSNWRRTFLVAVAADFHGDVRL
jgi:hypothetical protein